MKGSLSTPNEVIYKDELITTLKLTKNQTTTIDSMDYDKIKMYRWYAQYSPHTNSFYAYAHTPMVNKKRKLIKIHRVIMNLGDPTIHIDHKNHNTLDNRKENLRLCTRFENMHNAKKPIANSSGFKGVYFNKSIKKFHAHIRVNSKLKHLGYFNDAIEAAHAYDEAAREYFGEFANVNFKEESNSVRE